MGSAVPDLIALPRANCDRRCDTRNAFSRGSGGFRSNLCGAGAVPGRHARTATEAAGRRSKRFV